MAVVAMMEIALVVSRGGCVASINNLQVALKDANIIGKHNYVAFFDQST